MSQLVNKIVIEGNLTADPDMKYLNSGTAVCKINVAVNDKVKRGEKWENETDFFVCEFWGKQAELLTQWSKKGDKIRVSGKMKSSKYEDKDGNNRIFWFIKADFQDGFKLYNTKKKEENEPDDQFLKALNFGIESEKYVIARDQNNNKMKNKDGNFIVIDTKTGEEIDVQF